MSDVLLCAQDITKRFMGTVALKCVSLNLHENEILAVMGEAVVEAIERGGGPPSMAVLKHRGAGSGSPPAPDCVAYRKRSSSRLLWASSP